MEAPRSLIGAEVVLSVPALDEALDEQHLASLFLPTGLLADSYVSPSKCEATDCPRCRVGRMLIVLSKSHYDALGALAVLDAVAPLLKADPEQRDVVNHGDFDAARGHVLVALKLLESAGIDLARAMGQKKRKQED